MGAASRRRKHLEQVHGTEDMAPRKEMAKRIESSKCSLYAKTALQPQPSRRLPSCMHYGTPTPPPTCDILRQNRRVTSFAGRPRRFLEDTANRRITAYQRGHPTSTVKAKTLRNLLVYTTGPPVPPGTFDVHNVPNLDRASSRYACEGGRRVQAHLVGRLRKVRYSLGQMKEYIQAS